MSYKFSLSFTQLFKTISLMTSNIRRESWNFCGKWRP